MGREAALGLDSLQATTNGAVEMLGWEHPEIFLLSPLIVLALILYRRSKKNVEALEKLFVPVLRRKYLRISFTLFKLLFLASVLVAAAGPYYTYQVEEHVPVEDARLLKGKPVMHVILIDVSKSMSYQLGLTSRLDAAKKLLETYLSKLGEKDVVHLVAFYGEVRPLYTGKPVDAVAALNKLRADKKYTAIGDALAYACSYARASRLPAVILLVSDGKNNYGGDPVQAAEVLREANVPLAVVAVGDDGVLGRVAEAAGGKVYLLNEFTSEAVLDFASQVARDARYSALSARGEAVISKTVYDYSPAVVAAVLAVVFFVASMVEGV